MSAGTIVVSAVAFVRGGHVLAVRKRGTARFMLVGGKPEAGEDAEQTAVRETFEEVGLVIDSLQLLGEFESPAANEPGHVLHSTVFTAELPGEPTAAAEIEELRWIPLDSTRGDLAPMLRDDVLPLLRAAHSSSMAGPGTLGAPE
ncbi:NUDIX hydrolase [Nocardioides alcanivorans]|uniref:NUDIX hydrolase n=1 Tax=Nocardioides alcanivorans TaxID=2897352 RepID=UPI001F2FE864|nr:NUDIX domain-containing protein [Nocardioides alcanivorans]